MIRSSRWSSRIEKALDRCRVRGSKQDLVDELAKRVPVIVATARTAKWSSGNAGASYSFFRQDGLVVDRPKSRRALVKRTFDERKAVKTVKAISGWSIEQLSRLDKAINSLEELSPEDPTGAIAEAVGKLRVFAGSVTGPTVEILRMPRRGRTPNIERTAILMLLAAAFLELGQRPSRQVDGAFYRIVAEVLGAVPNDSDLNHAIAQAKRRVASRV